MGDSTWPEATWVTNRSREYTMVIPVVVNAILTRYSAPEAEGYLVTQLTAIESTFNADSQLRSTGVVNWGLAPRMLGTQPSGDGGLEAQLVADLHVTYRP